MNYKVHYLVTANEQTIDKGHKIVDNVSGEITAVIIAGLEIEKYYKDNPGLIKQFEVLGKVVLLVNITKVEAVESPSFHPALRFLKTFGVSDEIIARLNEKIPGRSKQPASDKDKYANHPLITGMRELNAPESLIAAAENLLDISEYAPDKSTKDWTIMHIEDLMKKVADVKKNATGQNNDHPLFNLLKNAGIEEAYINEDREILFCAAKHGPNAQKGVELIFDSLLAEINRVGKIKDAFYNAAQAYSNKNKPAREQVKRQVSLQENANTISVNLRVIRDKARGTCRINGRPGYILEHNPETGYASVFCLGGFNNDCELLHLYYKDGETSTPVSAWSLRSEQQANGEAKAA